MAQEKMQFKTEVNKLLELMIHSLYSHKEIFLRELISNGSDAIDKLRFEAIKNDALTEGDANYKIKLTADKEAGTLTISDNGIGMTKDEAVNSLGTIAHSGTKEFMKLLESKEVKDNPELIGQFGVGFYSAFMVADKVTVTSRKAGEDKSVGIKWESNADGSFTIEQCEKETKGTDVVLYMKEEDKNYLDEWEIKEVVKKYSDYISYPVVMDTTKKVEDKDVTEEETLNSMKAIWLKDKSDVTQEEYNEFYKHITHDFGDPLKTIHYRAEGTTEFNVLVYLPKKAPMNILYPEYKSGPALYVRRVQIMENCEDLVPVWLRFVKGIVDSSDLPLNVSRELLQKNKMMDIIRKNITKKVLETIKDMKQNEYETYVGFFEEFGRVIKEGIHFDFARKEEIADLLLVQSTSTESGKYTTLADYVSRMKTEQNEIYYITGKNRKELENSPYLEALKEKDYEVLFMTDEIDDIIISSLMKYKDKNFKSILKGDINLQTEEEKKESKENFGKLTDKIKDILGDKVSEVRLSARLKNSPCVLVSGDGDIDMQMEMMLKAMGQAVPPRQKILELNPTHALVTALNTEFDKDAESQKVADIGELLYNQALILEGSMPEDTNRFTQLLTKVMTENVK
ncbi:heat shock protein Hsp90 [Denitrovibrio acetiphilus DSM 12809]|uniref:Chaperone protein HtpG n=1 Tax=Denitrovibrio acetiphilus (strain DSM 12809 / NBRC 114555 / N2460) TaxID=522772 RepID=D4H633_DENA2|nr:molecular chaperone HtpG [Denitrovibrio acetiphilus]ADD67679.1 heat shock protein Hsp90 [Denitrovibrio acetiphilus DSM 12809]